MANIRIWALLATLLFAVGLTAPVWAATDVFEQNAQVQLKVPATPPDENPSDKGENPPGGGHGKGGIGGDNDDNGDTGDNGEGDDTSGDTGGNGEGDDTSGDTGDNGEGDDTSGDTGDNGEGDDTSGNTGDSSGDNGSGSGGNTPGAEADSSVHSQRRDNDHDRTNPARFYKFTEVFDEGQFRPLNSGECTQVVWKGIRAYFIAFLASCDWSVSDAGPTLSDLGHTWLQETGPRFYVWDPETGRMLRLIPN